ncbi:MAG: pantoate kinase [Methanobacterium sp.]
MKSSLFVPSHITGFFQIIPDLDPLRKGSRGAGIVLDKGVITDVSIEDGKGVDVIINGESESKLSSITYKTIDLIKERFPIVDKITINHEFQVPVGSGFGVSAACALGTSLGIVKALKLPLTYNRAASIAHLAEIEMKSGLGDVIAEITGGLVIRLKEGAPGYGRTDRILPGRNRGDDEYYIISKTLGEIETSTIIEDPYWQKRINQTGETLLGELLEKPDIHNFFKLSRRFAEETSLMNSQLKEVVDILEEETLGASMAMLGNTAFALSKTPDTSLNDVIVSKIDDVGCRFLKIT